LLEKHYRPASTHILPEVEATCSRVAHPASGRDIGGGHDGEPAQNAFSRTGPVIAEIAAPMPDLLQAWAEVETVMHVDVSAMDGEFHRCALTPRDGIDLPTGCLRSREGARLAAP
jgi:hypothetical protein